MGELAFTYDALPGRVVFGAGSRARLADEIERAGYARVLVIAGAEEQAMADELMTGLGDLCAGRFDDVVQHVPESKAAVAVDLATRLGVDATVTIGGGSATGFGKAVALSSGLPQIAVPTTYAGSEMTPIWGLSDGSRKRTGRDPRVQPDVVIYDPELTLSLPPRIAGPSGMNALAHCVEALYGPGANPVISLLSLEGIRALSRALPAVCAEPTDLEARTDALYGAYLAACALAVGGTALHHKACHVLGGMFDLNHGDMNSVVLPHALRYNQPAIGPEYERMSEALGADAADALYDLARVIGAPAGLDEIGMPESGIADAAVAVVAEAAANARTPDLDGIVEMLTTAWRGDRPAPLGVETI